MSTVRPFHARLVRAERSADLVIPQVDPVDEHAGAHSADVDRTAYDDAGTALFVYRQQRDGESHTGVVCEVRAEAFVDGRVRGHEAVHPDRVAALLERFAKAPDRPGLATLLHRPGEVYTRTVDRMLRTEPHLDFPGPDGLRQSVWRVPPGEETRALAAELGRAHHYVADGHHRVAATLSRWRLVGDPDGTGLLCVVYPMDGLRLSAFHRRVTGPLDPRVVRATFDAAFDVQEVEAPPGTAPGRFGVYVDGTWWVASFRGERPPGLAGLDVALLEERVLSALAGPATGREVEAAPARVPLAVLTGRCDADGGVLVTLAPPPLHVLTDLADRGEVMPPKTTFFEPKPCAGIFLRG